jgi:exodeoxyribonuclease V beta subunit
MSATASTIGSEYSRSEILKQILDGGHKILDASAGTGKTLTIERIVVDLILNRAATIDQILVVTFTEKATAELRGRLRASLDAVLSMRLSDAQRDSLNTALTSFHLSPIHTIHSFCHRMLTELAFDSGVRFGLDLAAGRREFHDALRAELRERLKSDARVDRLVTEWLADEKRTAGTLEDLLSRAHSQRYLRTDGRAQNQQALSDLLNRFDAKALTDGFRRAAMKTDACAAAHDATCRLEAMIAGAAGSSTALADALNGFDFDPLCKPAKTPNAINRILERMSPQMRAIIDAALRAQAALAIEARAVDELLPGVAARMDARKRERGTLDYEDMLAWLAAALDGPRGEALAATLRARYRVTLIDEFQDTDQLQWKIFRHVFVEGGAGNTVFVIGDPKQAIYGFRGADVNAYLEARDQLTRAGAATINLRENFRSTGAVIDACNLIFDQAADEPLFEGEIKYAPPAQCGRPALRAIDPEGNVIAPLTLLKFEPSGPRHRNSHWMRQAIGNRIANAIRRIIHEPAHAITICDEGRAPRKITAQNVYVLTRSNRDSVEMSKHLRDVGVPFAFYKQDGLFQTREASYVLDVLRGIDQPGRRSARLKAWATPFFAVDYADLDRLADEHTAHPMYERLFEWRALAEAERFADLFDALLNQSGLAERLLLSDGRRELTNYEHIFEILTRDASRRGVSLGEIIDQLNAYIAERATPPGDDQNIQRVETDRDAVQIMTIHKSKGLEADVIALYGGFFASTQPDPVSVYHRGNERCLAIGKPARDLHKQQLDQERDEENQRLLYVALTRARAKLLLPYVPKGTLTRDLWGCYEQLNDRLRKLDGDERLQALSATEIASAPLTAAEDKPQSTSMNIDDDALCGWLASTAAPALTESDFDSLRKRHPGLITESYTSLQAADAEDFKTSVDTADAQIDHVDLPGGRRVGIFLHEALEKLDFSSIGDAPDFRSWMERADVRDLFSAAMRRHGVSDPRWLDRGREIVFNALTARIALGDVVIEDGLYRLPKVSEMEFVYPIPESHHAMLDDATDGAWTVDRGYIKGFIDLVFRRGELMYFADWKGDLLASYEPDAVAHHVAMHYRLQAQIYSVGVMRLLGIHSALDYNAKFGGLLYVFLRGVKRPGDGKTGFYFARPSWNEILTYESSLMTNEPYSESAT